MTPPPQAYQAAPAPAVPAGGGGSRKKWIIGGSIAAGVLLVGGIGNALAGGRDEEPTPTVTVLAEETQVESPAPEPEPEPTEEEPTPVETATPVDPAVFTSQANSHLDDILKDLDDIEVTIEERGFWRLLSNYGELSFNLGQLGGLEIPASMTEKWPATLADLEASMDAYSETIGTEDAAKMREAVAGIRAQVETTRGVAASAE